MDVEQRQITFPGGLGSGESAESAGGAVTVSALLEDVRQMLDENFRRVIVCGEISGFRQHASGHTYFVLKDEQAQVRAVLWRSTARRLTMAPRDGMQVQIRGRIELYPPRGEMQLVVDSMRLDGDGAAQAALEALKRQLHKEGLFSRSAKKRLPPYPERIGVVTSGSGAALHDITSILARRYPVARVIVCAVRVQGVDAPAELARAIAEFNSVPNGHEARADVLIVGRGGGSAEDLWAFNEEVVARAIFASDIPIVSAVGHETDVTISDFVADVRAATPSMAAELVVPDQNELRAALKSAMTRMDEAVLRQLNQLRQRIDYLTGSYHFRRTIDRLDRLTADISLLRKRATLAVRRIIGERKLLAAAMLRQVQSSDPRRPLRSGYALVRRADDQRLVTSKGLLDDGVIVSLTFHDGGRNAEILPETDDFVMADGRTGDT